MVSVGLGLTVAAGVYIGACLVLRVRELDTLRSLSARVRRA
jgi:hypothetical protein